MQAEVGMTGLISRMFSETGIPVPTKRTISKWIDRLSLQKIGYRIGSKKIVLPQELYAIANIAWAIGVGMSRKNILVAIDALNKARKIAREGCQDSDPHNSDIVFDFFNYSIGVVRDEFVVLVVFDEDDLLDSTPVVRFEGRSIPEEIRLEKMLPPLEEGVMQNRTHTIPNLVRRIRPEWTSSFRLRELKGVLLEGDIGIVRVA